MLVLYLQTILCVYNPLKQPFCLGVSECICFHSTDTFASIVHDGMCSIIDCLYNDLQRASELSFINFDVYKYVNSIINCNYGECVLNNNQCRNVFGIKVDASIDTAALTNYCMVQCVRA
jgi:hypothetical protein